MRTVSPLRLVAKLAIVVVVVIPTMATADTCHKKAKVGVVLPLTDGPVSSGTATKQSIKLASDKYDPGKCVEFIFEDDKFQPKNTVSAVNKLIYEDRVDGLIIYGTPTSLAVNSIAERAQVPMIALSILDKVVANKFFVMKHWCRAEALNDAVQTEVKRRGYRRVAIVSTINDAMLRLRDLFKTVRDAKIVQDDEFLKDELDFTAAVLRAKKVKADALYILLYPPQTGVFVRKAHELGLSVPMFGVHNVEDPHEVSISKNAMVGMWYANGNDQVGEAFTQDYMARYHTRPALGGGSGYDVANMFIKASQQRETFNVFLHSLREFRGAYGIYGATISNDFDFKAAIKEVTADGFRILR